MIKAVLLKDMKMYHGVIVNMQMNLILLIYFKCTKKQQMWTKSNRWLREAFLPMKFMLTPRKNYATSKTYIYTRDDTRRTDLLEFCDYDKK